MVSWMVVEHHPYWKDRFERLEARIGKKKAIVAIARKLLVVVWHVLSKQEADRHSDQEMGARKIRGGCETNRQQREGLSRVEFVMSGFFHEPGHISRLCRQHLFHRKEASGEFGPNPS
jgi:hypothetical protein